MFHVNIVYLCHHSAGALVQLLKLPAWKVGDRGFEPHSGLQVSKKQNTLPVKEGEIEN